MLQALHFVVYDNDYWLHLYSGAWHTYAKQVNSHLFHILYDGFHLFSDRMEFYCDMQSKWDYATTYTHLSI